MSENPNKIQRLQLENFTCFERADLAFSPGINVFIGENGTGKTHLLKAVYGSIHSDQNVAGIQAITSDFREYFAILNTKQLVKNPDINPKATINILTVNDNVTTGHYVFFSNENRISSNTNALLGIKNSLYIPTPEMLSWQKAFSRFMQSARLVLTALIMIWQFHLV
ncbi:MAG: AAA family ATPase [Saprospiraceae bacterium]|nr:AAA family ATPase [Saprospiraceae bacterium]